MASLHDAVSSGLPSLKYIMVCDKYGEPAGPSSFPNGTMDKFIDMCSARGVVVKRRGNGYTKADELAYMMDYPEEMAAEIVDKQNFGVGSGYSFDTMSDDFDLEDSDESDYE